jgi:hypothetical protein
VDLDYWEYAWAYPVEVKKQTLSLVVDATKHGNQLRFVNDGGPTSNCRVVYTIFKYVTLNICLFCFVREFLIFLAQSFVAHILSNHSTGCC